MDWIEFQLLVGKGTVRGATTGWMRWMDVMMTISVGAIDIR